MAVGTSARKEMLLERLPYMVSIAKAGKSSSSSALGLRDMEKVTAFHGIGKQSEDNPDEGDDTAIVGEEWATDRPVEGKSPRKRGLAIRGRGTTTLSLQQPEQKLVLSDDDIEDD
jgi:cell cycle checkpoint protein